MGAEGGVQRWRSLTNELGVGGDDEEWWSSSKIVCDATNTHKPWPRGVTWYQKMVLIGKEVKDFGADVPTKDFVAVFYSDKSPVSSFLKHTEEMALYSTTMAIILGILDGQCFAPLNKQSGSPNSNTYQNNSQENWENTSIPEKI